MPVTVIWMLDIEASEDGACDQPLTYFNGTDPGWAISCLSILGIFKIYRHGLCWLFQ